MNLHDVMRNLYASEINCGVSSFWDGGWRVWLGDELNGVVAHIEGCDTPQEAAQWLDSEARRQYPQSDYAKRKPHPKRTEP